MESELTQGRKEGGRKGLEGERKGNEDREIRIQRRTDECPSLNCGPEGQREYLASIGHIVRKVEIEAIVLNLIPFFVLVYKIQYLCPEKNATLNKKE